MKKLVAAAALLLALTTFALRAEDPPAPAPGGLDTIEKKASYAFGFNLGKQIKAQAEIDRDAIIRGIQDGMNGTAPLMSEAAMQQAVMEFQKVLEQNARKAQAEKGKKNKEEGAAFLEKNKTAEGVKTTPSGLQYKCVKEGNGQKPLASDTVVVNYEGTLIDGTVFDSSYKRGSPAEFPLSGVIPGWTEGLQHMDVGGTYILYVPSELGYREFGSGPTIGPNAVLIFKIEILEIKKHPK